MNKNPHVYNDLVEDIEVEDVKENGPEKEVPSGLLLLPYQSGVSLIDYGIFERVG